MNQISTKFSSVCRSSSLLRKNSLTRWSPSSKHRSSSSCSNPLTVFISKFHNNTFNYPPQKILSIPTRNHIRKCSGEVTSAECNIGDDDLKQEICCIEDELIEAEINVDDSCYDSTKSPLDAVKIPSDMFNAFMEKFGINNQGKAGDGDFPAHLERFRKDIERLEERVDEMVALGEFVAAGGVPHLRDEFLEFQDWCDARGKGGETFENNMEIFASLQQMEIKSRLMRQLIEDVDRKRKNRTLNQQ